VGRNRFVLVAVVVVAVAVAIAAAVDSRSGAARQPKPVLPALTNGGVSGDDANMMRRLQRQKLVRSHK